MAGWVVVLIPESRELRRMPRYTLTDTTDIAGNDKIRGVIPGVYFLIATAKSTNHPYFATDFADRNRAQGGRLRVDSGGAEVANLQVSNTP